MRWQQLKSGRPFSYETHFSALSITLSIITTIFLNFIFLDDWKKFPLIISIQDTANYLIPALKNLNEHPHLNTEYWRAFFSTHYLLLPIHFLIGLAGGAFLDSHQKNRMFAQASPQKIALAYAFIFLASYFVFTFPLVDLGAFHKLFIDQASSFLPKQIFSWLIATGINYGLGVSISAFIKNKLII